MNTETRKHYLRSLFHAALCCLLLFSAFCVMSYADDYPTSGDFSYQILGSGNSRYVEIMKYNGTASTVKVPEKIAGLPVTVINGSKFSGIGAFANNKSIVNVTLPNTITFIGGGGFRGCTSLKNVNIPKSLTYLGNYAFEGCSQIIAANIPASVTSVGDKIFANCSSLKTVVWNSAYGIPLCAFENCPKLTKVTLSNKVSYIGLSAFKDCISLSELVIGSKESYLESVAADAFRNCPKLKKITYAGKAAWWKAISIKEGNDAFKKAKVTYITSGIKTSFPAPTGVKITYTDHSTCKVTWKKVSGAGMYVLYKKGPSDSKYLRVNSISAGSFAEKGGLICSLPIGKNQICVAAANAHGDEGKKSKAVAAYGLGLVKNLKARKSSGKYTVTWSKTSGASGYIVRYSFYNSKSGKDAAATKLATKYLGSSKTSITITNPSTKKYDTFFVQVFPYRKIGKVRYSINMTYQSWYRVYPNGSCEQVPYAEYN